jgi:hypothetical protein
MLLAVDGHHVFLELVQVASDVKHCGHHIDHGVANDDLQEHGTVADDSI